MANPGAKEQFLKQFENIVEGIKQNKAKVSITKHMLKSFSSFKLLFCSVYFNWPFVLFKVFLKKFDKF